MTTTWASFDVRARFVAARGIRLDSGTACDIVVGDRSHTAAARPNSRRAPAGEHCSQDFQGFMEGGASEGVRAAGEILTDIKFG